MCEPDRWWWIIFGVMAVSGVFGGVVRYHWDKFDGGADENWFSYAILGIGAALMVPLFLNTISSTLIKEATADQTKVFILIGFCLSAAVFAKQFMGSLSRKALEISQEAKQIANEANQTAVIAEKDAKSADNRAIAMFAVLKFIDADNFNDALGELEQVLANDPDYSEAWAWKAFCLKRIGRFNEALSAIQRALLLEGREIYSWLYNMACYQCLAGLAIDEVIATLKRIQRAASTTQIKGMKNDFLNEPDLDRMKTKAEFMAFIESLSEGS